MEVGQDEILLMVGEQALRLRIQGKQLEQQAHQLRRFEEQVRTLQVSNAALTEALVPDGGDPE